MKRIKVNGHYIIVPENIETEEKNINKSDNLNTARTLHEDEVLRLIEIKKINLPPNPNTLEAIHLAQIDLLEKAAKSNKKWARLFFYIVFALLPTSCVEMALYNSAKLDQISWLWVFYFGVAIALIALQIFLISTERSKE